VTKYYAAWLTALSNRDTALINLSLVAVVLVLAWALVPTTFKKVQKWLYRMFMAGGIILFIYLLVMSLTGKI
jgi:hypothetical protein